MTKKEIEDSLCESGYEDTILYSNPDYADAFIGVTTDGMVKCLINDGMEEIEAIEWVEYNCIGAKGEGLPVVMHIANPAYEAKEEPKPVIVSDVIGYLNTKENEAA